MTARIPTPTVIRAASEIVFEVPSWSESLAAIGEVRHRLDLSRKPDAIVAAAAISALLGVRSPDIVEDGIHLCRTVLLGSKHSPEDLVKILARVKEGAWRISFASKAVHFLVRPDTVPPFDSLADSSVRVLLGEAALTGGVDYSEYHSRVDRLRSGQIVSYSELDRVLWLCGKYDYWVSAGKKNRGVFAKAFLSPSKAMKEVLDWYTQATDT